MTLSQALRVWIVHNYVYLAYLAFFLYYYTYIQGTFTWVYVPTITYSAIAQR